MKPATFNILTGTLIAGAVVAAGVVGWPTIEASVHEMTRPVAVPTSTTVYSGCTVTKAGTPFWVNASANDVPRALVLTCGGESTTVKGDFTDRTNNHYDTDATGIRAALMVADDGDGPEARIFHVGEVDGRPADCITIQALTASSPSMDMCTVQA